MRDFVRCVQVIAATWALMASSVCVLRAAEGELEGAVAKLVAQMDDRDAAQRDAAEKGLIKLGMESKDGGAAFLTLLPTPDDDMSQEVATRLARIRGEVQSRLARQMVVQTRVTLEVTDAPLAEVLTELEKQTGNHVVDQREKQGQEAPEKRVTVKVADVPFWAALDEILDQANMSPYPFADEFGLALVEREQGTLRRVGRATYAGPFRIEPTDVSTERGLRNPERSGLEVDMEISWEPRLRPVALSQTAADLKAVADDGLDVPTTAEGEAKIFNVEVPADGIGAEVTLPLRLPARAAVNLKSVKGRMTALVPGRIADVRFDKLAEAADASQEVGGVTVTLNRVVQNQALWEVHMRVGVAQLAGGGDAQRGWVFQNVTYLEGPDGAKVEHAGFETTMQNERETGFAYFFELPEGADIADYTWVYRTPAAIVELPVEYELEEIPLP
jgi:hypothetical protein